MANIAFGPGNRGLQVGGNNGQMDVHIHSAPEIPETPPSPQLCIPFPPNSDFIDRVTLSNDIHQKASRAAARVAVVGLGGIGKTQLLIQYSYRVGSESPKKWVFWIHASDTISFERGYRDIADRLKIVGRHDSSANIFQLVHDWLVDEGNGKWVLILDNMDDSRFLHETPFIGKAGPAEARPLLAYLPVSSHGSILISSRTSEAVSGIVNYGDIITVAPMDLLHATKLFRKKLEDVETKDEDIQQLAAALDCIPLAMAQAASVIQQQKERVSVRRYLENFQKSVKKIASLLEFEKGKLLQDWGTNQSILSTLKISFDQIRNSHSGAADLLSLMSFFDYQHVQVALLHMRPQNLSIATRLLRVEKFPYHEDDDTSSQSSMDCEFENNLQVLKDYSLISIHVDGKSFKMHRLVQIAMQLWLKDQDQFEKWQGKFIEVISHWFPTPRYHHHELCSLLFSHVQCAMEQRPKEKILLLKWSVISTRASLFLFLMGDTTKCIKIALSSLETVTDAMGPDHNMTIVQTSTVASIYSQLGQLDLAEKFQEQVMCKFKETHGQRHPSTLESTFWLASIHFAQGKHSEAKSTLEHILKPSEQVFGREDPFMLDLKCRLASIYRADGEIKEAQGLEMQVLKCHEESLGSADPNTFKTMRNFSSLAFIHQAHGRWEDAESLRFRALMRWEWAFGPENPHTLTAMSDIADGYMIEERWEDAECVQSAVFESRKKALGPEHLETLLTMMKLAICHSHRARWDKAEATALKAINLMKEVLGEQHPETVSSLHCLAKIYARQGRGKDAEVAGLQALESRARLSGLEDKNSLSVFASLGSFYYQQNKLEQSEALHFQVMEMAKKLGLLNRNILRNMQLHAKTLRALSRFKEADQRMTECLALQGEILGHDDPDIMVSKSFLECWRTEDMNGTQSESSAGGYFDLSQIHRLWGLVFPEQSLMDLDPSVLTLLDQVP
ncbi:hypothetical protein N7456_001923 [Penicillium angulare]|uniref:NB-ARC domain-containing protein n=1 Tax=Penicillium angulare TaxID=116970 RepID=A0A9W9G7F2_9EURO|nr:hypothetical protein N7456_001923 [Penicillium angulare]